MAIKRDIQYINKDFSQYRAQLINYSQTYFPSTYTDFTETSPGMMFIEQAAYVGDVLSFYIDNQVQETYLQYARQNNNLYELAYMYGYKPKVTGLSTVDIDFYQQVPAKTTGSNNETVPDYAYALYVNENTIISTRAGTPQNFTIDEPIDFSISNSMDPTNITVAQITAGQPTYYLLRKSRKGFSGTINSTTITFTNPEDFGTRIIEGVNIAGILDVIDSDGNTWYEVDYLGQDLIFDGIKNTNYNDPNAAVYSNDTPYILQTKQVQNRFTTRFISPTKLQIQFGVGNPLNTTEQIIPNPQNVGLGLPFQQSKLTTAYSPTNFVFTNTYGTSPTNTTLTIRYYTGGGVASNVESGTITNLNTTNVNFIKSGLNPTTADTIFNSLASTNQRAASGGQDGDTLEEIRQNSISNFPTQLRNVTQDDYLVRALSMPPKFGIISKAWTQKPEADTANTTLDLYVLSTNANNKLTTASDGLKQNLKTYINEYRMIGDTISIKDAFVINYGVNFEIITYPNFNNNIVLQECIVALQSYFQTDKWQINQPIIEADVMVLLDRINGVQTVKKLTFTNLAGIAKGYSQWAYDMDAANQNGTIFPSLDPSIFELKFPNNDITGRVVVL